MAPNIVYDNCNDCDCDEKVKRAYWNCLAFLVYNELKEKEISVIHDIQKLMVCLRESLDKWKTIAYWIWHDLLDIMNLIAPENQDWIDDISPKDEEVEIIKAIIYPDQFGKTCWYWLDLIVNGVDEVGTEQIS